MARKAQGDLLMRSRTISFFAIIAMMALSPALSARVVLPPTNTFWVGMEDQQLPGGDKDYQDMVIKLQGLGLAISGSGSWQKMVLPNQDGTPFWDGVSSDGANMNIANFMLGTGGFTGNPNSPDLKLSQTQYWGMGTGASNSFEFSGVSDSAKMLIEVAGWADNNSLYWDNSGGKHLLFSGPAGAGATISFSPGAGPWWLELDSPGGVFTTYASGKQFAVFEQTGIPEPATFILLGAGLVFLGYRRRSRA